MDLSLCAFTVQTLDKLVVNDSATRVISQEKQKGCTHLRNSMIWSVRGLTLVHLVAQILFRDIYIYKYGVAYLHIYILGNHYTLPISTNPLRNISQKHSTKCLLTSYLTDFEIRISYSES